MKGVCIAAESSLPCGHRWDSSAGDLAIEVCSPLLDRAPIDAVVAAAPAASRHGQANIAALLVDRLGLAGKVATSAVDAGDASGAAALHSACSQVAAGLARAVLVIGVAKVSDESEKERSALLDALIDQEAEAAVGLTFAAQAGLWADAYLAKHGIKRGVFSQVVAKNAHNAFTGGETFLKHAPTPQELRRDLAVAAPLLRSDFAPLFDGATALLVADSAVAREICDAPVAVRGIGNSSDLSVLWDRPEPLQLSAAARAAARALTMAGQGSPGSMAFVEIHNSCSLLEVLALETLGLTEPGKTGAMLKDGFGRLGAELVVNPSGGQHGRGMSFGVAGLEQAREAFLQHSSSAGKRQVEGAPGKASLLVSLGGLGTQALATVLEVSNA
jgi:acetyl-CoA acetyltransferase